MEIRRLEPYDVLGEHVAIDAFDPIAASLTAALRDLAPAEPATRHLTVERFTDDSWSVAWPDEQRYEGPSTDMAFYDVLCALNDAASRRFAAGGGAGLHGGAVAVDGTGVALVGHSGAGKSTLTARLVLDGHAFIADEVAAIDPDGTLQPFHRPIGLRPSSLPLLGMASDVDHTARTIPLIASDHTTLAGPTPLGLIAFVDRLHDDTEPQTVSVRPAEALHRLCNQTLGTHGLEHDVFHRLERLVHTVPAVSLQFRSLDDGAALVAGAARSL